MRAASLTLCLLSATLIPAYAPAQTETSPKNDKPAAADQGGMNNPKRQELLKKYDKNGDGRLDENELADARADMRKEGEGNGARLEREKKLLKQFDKNGDGKLDDTERAAAEKAAEKFRANEAQRREEILKRFDKDGDGELNDAERAEAEKYREQLLQEQEARREKKNAKK